MDADAARVLPLYKAVVRLCYLIHGWVDVWITSAAVVRVVLGSAVVVVGPGDAVGVLLRRQMNSAVHVPDVRRVSGLNFQVLLEEGNGGLAVIK